MEATHRLLSLCAAPEVIDMSDTTSAASCLIIHLGRFLLWKNTDIIVTEWRNNVSGELSYE